MSILNYYTKNKLYVSTSLVAAADSESTPQYCVTIFTVEENIEERVVFLTKFRIWYGESRTR